MKFLQEELNFYFIISAKNVPRNFIFYFILLNALYNMLTNSFLVRDLFQILSSIECWHHAYVYIHSDVYIIKISSISISN